MRKLIVTEHQVIKQLITPTIRSASKRQSADYRLQDGDKLHAANQRQNSIKRFLDSYRVISIISYQEFTVSPPEKCEKWHKLCYMTLDCDKKQARNKHFQLYYSYLQER